MASHAIFLLTALAFVPLHAFVGPNVAIGLVSFVALAIGASLAMPRVVRSPRRQAVLSLSTNALGLLFVGAVLEPLSMLGK
jgi:hypothetical protein